MVPGDLEQYRWKETGQMLLTAEAIWCVHEGYHVILPMLVYIWKWHREKKEEIGKLAL